MLNIETRAQNSTSGYSTRNLRRNKGVLRFDLNAMILSVLRMDSGSPFQIVCAAEEKRRAAVLVRAHGTVGKSILADLSPRHGTYVSSVSSK